MKKLIAFAAVLAIILSLGTSAFACTGMYVGKEVSEDGTTMLVRSVDTHPLTTTCRAVVVERVENQPGRVLESSWGGFRYELPATTYQYTATPFTTSTGGGYESCCANEMGLAVTGTVTAYIRDEIAQMDPAVEGGLNEQVIPALVASCCSTAREAVEFLADVIAEHGNSEQNIIMIADQNEAWYMETYTGYQWCAVKMPEDMVAVFGNEFMIGAIDPDSEDVLYSDGLFSMPEAAGLAVYTDDGLMDIFATYSGPDRLANYANRRTWYGHVMLNAETAGEYNTTTRYDLFYAPAEKVSLVDAFEVMRARFEGTEWDPDANDRLDQRVIGTETQATTHVIQIYDDLPAAMCCVSWVSLANSEFSVFLPMSNLITDTADSFKLDADELTYDTSLASVAFRRLCALSEQDRTYYGAGVREYWHDEEVALAGEYPSVLAETAALYEKDPAAAAEYITDYTVSLQEQAYEDAMFMFDELTWYMIENTDTLHYRFSYSTLTMSDAITQTPYVPSLAASAE